jgi:hypothetical protein
MKHFHQIRAILKPCDVVMLAMSMLGSIPVWSQTENVSPQQPVPAMVGVNNSAAPEVDSYNPENSGDRMTTPPAVSGQAYPIALTSEERSNYLRGGLSFMSAYTDNALGDSTGHPISDISYSVSPIVALDETVERLHLVIAYAPGFTFYHRFNSRNEADQNASVQFQYRLSPHVTFSASDSFQKSSNVFNTPPDFASGVVSAGAQGANFSVIAPIADRLSNSANVGLSYQFALNDMVGASGTFADLHYPDPTQVPGLYDSSSQGGMAFYSHRVARSQYIGATYGYQRLLSHPLIGVNETQTHAGLLFYSFAPASSRFSFSLFGGPQYSVTVQPSSPPQQPQAVETRTWTPAGGVSLGWQRRLNSFALSYIHIVSSGGGLSGAVQLDSAVASLKQQITKTLSASVAGGYEKTGNLGVALGGNNDNGHSISGSASLQQEFGQHLAIQLGYSRIHQSYSNVQIISTTPNTNREFVSISYQFSRPLGR